MGGLEDAQLSGPLEVIAVPGEEGFPCAIVTVHRDTADVRTLRATSGCAATAGRPRAVAAVAALSRRAEIERAATIRRTHAELVAGGMASGLPEGEAILQANEGMERLGYYPRSPTLTATEARCAGTPNVFAISPEEFAAGLFPDIERAIAAGGEAVDKAMGEYIRHNAYDTSRQLNEFLAGRANAAFLVRPAPAAGGCSSPDSPAALPIRSPVSSKRLGVEGLPGMPYDCEPAQEVRRQRRHPVIPERDQGGRYVRAFIIILTFAIASFSGASVVAQEGHPLKGSWVGEWGPSKLHSDDLLLILNWDGKAITGMVNPGTDNIAIKSATLTPPPSAPGDWVVRIQFDAKDPSGAAVAYTLDGKIENLAFHNRSISGTWKSARESGKFKVQRQ